MKEYRCTDCNLHKICTSNKISGSFLDPEKRSGTAVWMLVGEAPGREEDQKGQVFVGKAGSLLRDLLSNLKFPPDQVYITNSVKCWPGPGNPTPNREQINQCRKHLEQEISRVKPKVIVMLGATALQSVSRRSKITFYRGKVWSHDGIYFVPTFHPSSVFYSPSRLDMIVEDLGYARKLGEESGIWDEVDVRILYDMKDVRDFFDFYRTFRDPVVNDLETNVIHPWDQGSKILTLGFSWKEYEGVSIPLHHKESPFRPEECDEIISLFKSSLLERSRNRYGYEAYNAVFDIMWLKYKLGFEDPYLTFDPYLAHHLLNEEIKRPSLSHLALKYTPFAGYDEKVKTMASQVSNYGDIPLSDLAYYNALDAVVTLALRNILKPQLEREHLTALYEKVVLPSTFSVIEFEYNGIKIDLDKLNDLMVEYVSRIVKIKDEIRSHPDIVEYERIKTEEKTRKYLESLKNPERATKTMVYEFNPRSHEDLRWLMFEHLKLEPVKKTSTGSVSTDKEVRERYRDAHPLMEMINDYLYLNKFRSSYFERFSTTDRNGIFHPDYDITGTVTGRYVSDLQQLPRSSTNKDVKKIIVSRFDGGNLISIDVKQAELRVICMVSRDERLRKIFLEGNDPHTMAAVWVYGISEDEVTKELRNEMKSSVSFGLPYGRHEASLARDFGWSVERAKEFKDRYFSIFPGVKDMITYYRGFAEEHGYVRNLLGRVRRLSNKLKSKDFFEREEALRQAVNFVIQSLSHDLLMYATYDIYRIMKRAGMRSLLTAEVHDSIIIDAYPGEENDVLRIASAAFSNLSNVFDFVIVPFEIEAEMGPDLYNVRNLE